MPLRPFPIPYNVGTDICHIPRIRQIVMSRNRKGARPQPPLIQFCNRLFNPLEHAIFMKRFDLKAPRYEFNTTGKATTIIAHLAGRWAAKEAIIKAVKPKPTFHDITILGALNSEPMAIVLDPSSRQQPRQDASGKVPEITTMEQLFNANGQVVKVSISHDGEFATAVCIASTETGGPNGAAKSLDLSQFSHAQDEPSEVFTDRGEVNDKYAL